MTAAAKRTLRILVVDDDEVQRRALRRAVLRGLGQVEVLEAGDGAAAMEALRRGSLTNAARCDVVLLDLEMGPVDGFGFLEMLRADPERRGTVVFVLSSHADAGSRARAYDHAVAGYIRKDRVDDSASQVLDLLRAYAAAVTFPGEDC